MLQKTAAALVLTTALCAVPALAQTTSPSTSPTTTRAPAPMAASSSASSKFVTDQEATQFRASKFVGLDVYGSDNEKIGDISEILVDGSGAAKAVVVGVGGFLGIGQKNVAVPWASLKWSNDKPPSRTASAPTDAPRSPPMTGGTAPMTTGSTSPTTAAPPAAPARSPAEQAAYNGYPDHAMVQLTKAELQDAPAFRYYSDTHSSSGAPSNATPTSSTPTKQ